MLDDEVGGGAHPPDRQEDVVVHEVGGQALDLFWEGRGEHERLAFARAGHVLALHDAADLGLKAHVQHAVGLVQGEVADPLERHPGPLHQVGQAAGRRDEQVAPALHVSQLVDDGGAPVHDDGADTDLVGELTGLVVDLGGQLPGRGQDQGQGEGLARPPRRLGARPQDVGDDGEAEGRRLARPRLRARHQVPPRHADGDGVPLDGGGVGVLAPGDVGHEGGA